MKVIKQNGLLNMDTPALFSVIDYLKDYEPETIARVILELKNRSENISKKRENVLIKYASDLGFSSLNDFIKSFSFDKNTERVDPELNPPSINSNNQKEHKKKASDGTIIAGFTFSILGGFIGIIIACTILFGKYDDRSKGKAYAMIGIAIISRIIWTIIGGV